MNAFEEIHILPPSGEYEQRWLNELWKSEWGGEIMVSRGHVYRLRELKSLVAKTEQRLIGAVVYRFDNDGGCELMSINATIPGAGIGTKLLDAVESETREQGCHRLWLITSNDNLDALRFYQRRDYRITAVHVGAIDEARRIKPTIPFVGNHGIEIHDELELSKNLK